MYHEAHPSEAQAALARTVLETAAPTEVETREDYEQSLRLRTEIEWALTDRARALSQTGDANSDYGFTLGYYGGGEGIDEYDNPILGHTESILSEQIDTLLESRQDGPVVYVDFGGGLGLSSIRLAAKYAQAITDGRLIMVVTNLGFPPAGPNESHPDIAQITAQSSPNSFEAADLEFIRRHQDLVTYIDTNALELHATTVFTHGQEPRAVPLKGNVDLLHEHFALTHSHIPDMALAVFDDLMSESGTMYLQTAYIRTDLAAGIHRSIVKEIETSSGTIDLNESAYEQRRLSALDVGIEILNRRFERLQSPDRRLLSVYRRRQAQTFAEETDPQAVQILAA